MSFAAKEESRYEANPVNLYLFEGNLDASLGFSAGTLGPFAFTNADAAITRDGIEFVPWPIKHGDIVLTSGQDKRTLTVDLARGTLLDELFNAYPPSQPVRLVIYRGHADDSPTVGNFPIEWTGQISGVNYPENMVQFTCEPTSATMQRPGLRRNYQLGCPLPLYGEDCQATKVLQARTVTAIAGNAVTINSAITTTRGVDGYLGGTIEWVRADGLREIATIVAINPAGNQVTLRGTTRGLIFGTAVSIAAGCNRTMDHCSGIHGNIYNFGGQPFIPLENPLGTSSIFY